MSKFDSRLLFFPCFSSEHSLKEKKMKRILIWQILFARKWHVTLSGLSYLQKWVFVVYSTAKRQQWFSRYSLTFASVARGIKRSQPGCHSNKLRCFLGNQFFFVNRRCHGDTMSLVTKVNPEVNYFYPSVKAIKY